MHELAHEFTSRKVSPWGGLKLVHGVYSRLGLKEYLSTLSLPFPGSNRGYDPVELIEGFMVSVIVGARRLAHTGLLRTDEVIKEIFGWKKGMASSSTFSRFFYKWDTEPTQKVFKQVMRYWFKQINIKKMTIDIDSTAVTRYGHQQGVKKGYNRNDRGEKSHHPIIAFCDELKMVVNAWMRPGNCHTADNIRDFLKELFEIISPTKVGLIRMDNGFYDVLTMEMLESKKYKCNYIIKAKLTNPMLDKILHVKDWVANDDCQKGTEYAEFEYQGHNWKKPRRIIVMRKRVKKEQTSKYLFQEENIRDEYVIQTLVTNTDLSFLQIHQLYNQRADCENRIKELKYDYSIDGFSLHNFLAMEAAFRWIMVAYNLMAMLRQGVMKAKNSPRLPSIRFQCIAIGSYLIKSGRNYKLKLAAEGKRRHFLEHFFENVQVLKTPFRISNA